MPFFAKDRHLNILLYSSSAIFSMLGLAYSSVPLYRLFCNATGFGGSAKIDSQRFAFRGTEKETYRQIQVRLVADASKQLRWKFKPLQKTVLVKPGESALCFYLAENTSAEDATGVATYNISPAKAAPYFNKIQCFCFEEQRLAANESVEMPVFFYIDRDFELDISMADVQEIVLSYTFFKTS